MTGFSKIVKFKNYYFGITGSERSGSLYQQPALYRSTDKSTWTFVMFITGGAINPDYYYADIATTSEKLYVLAYTYRTQSGLGYYSYDGISFSQDPEIGGDAFIRAVFAVNDILYFRDNNGGYFVDDQDGWGYSIIGTPNMSYMSACVSSFSNYPVELCYVSTLGKYCVAIYNDTTQLWSFSQLPDPSSDGIYENIIDCNGTIVITEREDLPE